MILHALFLAFVQAQTNGPYFGCSSFWPDVTAGQANTIADQCELYPGFPEIIGTVNVTVVYTTDWETRFQSVDKLSTLAGAIHRAAERSLAIYEDLATSPNIVIILTTLYGSTEDAFEYMPTRPQGPCQVLLYGDWATGVLNGDEQEAEQTIAHEMYHCVQAERLGNGPNPNACVWLEEGSAEYFSNVVYPTVNSEWSDFKDYHPEWPIYDHTGDNAYATDLFFQSLEQSRGIVYINSWVLSTTEDQFEDQERTRLSNLANFADDFHLFAQQYSLESIVDTGGQTIPIPNPAIPSPVAISLISDTSGIASLSTIPFTITVYTVSMDGGQTVTISSSAQGNQRVDYRQSSEVVWTTMPSGSVSSAEGTLVVPCNGGNPTTILILFTSAEDVDSDTVVLTITQQDQDDTCTCNQNNNRRRSLQRCKPSPISSAPSSSASTSSAPSSITPSPTQGCLGSDATPCFSGPAAAFGNNCFYGVSCIATTETSLYSAIVAEPCLAICPSSLTSCSTSSVSNAEALGWDGLYEVHCSGSGVAARAPVSAISFPTHGPNRTHLY